MTMAATSARSDSLERRVWKLYVRLVRPHIREVIHQQRLKLLWDVWGYAPILRVKSLPLRKRIAVVAKMLRVDWHVPHAHKPRELAAVLESVAERRAQNGEGFIEAGCWMGGSSAKFSLFCQLFGYRLHIYDSFQGVEHRTELEGDGTDFSGSYVGQLDVVRDNIKHYGDITVCEFHGGWFADTLAESPAFPVRGAYIDCDLVKGTAEVITSVVPVMVDDGWIYSQDYHITAVRSLLHSATLWERLGRAIPDIQHVYRNLARVELGARTSKQII